MQDVVAPVENIIFDIEISLNNQLGSQPLPFPGMDKSGAAICTFFLTAGGCSKSSACPFRHVKGDRTVVCKHWLRGLCKKGDDCEFLHEFDMTKMPECFFFSKYGQCNNKECPFLHIDPNQKMKDCPWYDRGFCRHGPHCKNRHVRRLICQSYLTGFCLDGPKCKYMHPDYDLPLPDLTSQIRKASLVCHKCGEFGHKSIGCPTMMGSQTLQPQPASTETASITITSTADVKPYRPVGAGIPGSGSHYGRGTYSHRGVGRGYHSHAFVHEDTEQGKRPLDTITCFKCGEKGHYANRCLKGDLAFLSNQLHHANN